MTKKRKSRRPWFGKGKVKKRPLIKDGRLMAIIRPEDPKAALADVKRIHRDSQSGKLSFEEAQRQLDEMLTKQPYRFMGIACRDGVTLLNHDYTKISGDRIKPGDSFVPYEQVLQMLGEPPETTD